MAKSKLQLAADLRYKHLVRESIVMPIALRDAIQVTSKRVYGHVNVSGFMRMAAIEALMQMNVPLDYEKFNEPRFYEINSLLV